MSQVQMNEMNQAITTVNHKASFNFRNWKQGQEGFNRLNTLLEAGKIAETDIAITPDKDGDESKNLYQRKPLHLDIEVPLVSSFIKDSHFTAAQLDHLQALINQTVEKAQQQAVDAGNPSAEDLTPWYVVLDAPFKQRTAAVKITEEMLKAAVTLFSDYLGQVGSSAKGIDLISNLSMKKFALTACVKVPRKVVERIQERVAGFFEAMSDEEKHTHTAVVTLWAGNIEKVLNPEVEDELDADMI
jgi:hypothetical protein